MILHPTTLYENGVGKEKEKDSGIWSIFGSTISVPWAAFIVTFIICDPLISLSAIHSIHIITEWKTSFNLVKAVPGAPSLGVKRLGCQLTRPLSSARVKNECSYTAMPSHGFMACMRVTLLFINICHTWLLLLPNTFWKLQVKQTLFYHMEACPVILQSLYMPTLVTKSWFHHLRQQKFNIKSKSMEQRVI